jgi:hypothetical protein
MVCMPMVCMPMVCMPTVCMPMTMPPVGCMPVCPVCGKSCGPQPPPTQAPAATGSQTGGEGPQTPREG